jgi:hypothetical protein
MGREKEIRQAQGLHTPPLLQSTALTPLHQCTSIEKAISQGLKPVAGNPDFDMTPENVERQVAAALL